MRITRHFLFKPAVALAVWSWLVPSVFMAAQAAPRAPQGVVSDWTHHHLLFPESTDLSLSARLRDDPRWLQSWYLRHPAAKPLFPAASRKHAHRDWNVSLGTTSFVPQFDSTFTFAISTQTGFGRLNLISQGAGSYLFHIRLVHIVVLYVLQHTFENSLLRIWIVSRLLCAGGQPGARERVYCQGRRKGNHRKFAFKRHQ